MRFVRRACRCTAHHQIGFKIVSEQQGADASSPSDVNVRLAALGDYDILDTPAEQGFDDLTLLASRICDTPVALVSLVDRNRQWFKARIGFPDCETDLSRSVCKFVLVEPDVLVIPDLTLDPRTKANPLVTGGPSIRFYAGAPLRTPEGVTVGSLCVIDTEPRPAGLTESQQETLRALGRQVTMLLDLRRKSATQARLAEIVRESEVRFRNMAEYAPVIMWVTDPAGYCTYLNRHWYEFTGQTPEEAEGYGWLDATHPDDKAEAERAFIDANAQRKAFRAEYRLRQADGTYRWAIDAATPRFGSDGEYLGYIGSVTDIDAQKCAQAALQGLNTSLERQVAARVQEIEAQREVLQTSQARQRVVFDLTRQLMGIMDLDGVLLEANPAALDAIDAKLGDVVGQPFWATPWFIGTPGMGELVKDAVGSARNGHSIRTELPLILPNGETRIYDFGMHPVRDASGHVAEIMPEATDITDLRKAEEALRQSQKMEAVGQLTGGLAHDFNNLLAGISGSLELMQTRMGQGRFSDLERYMSVAQGATKRAAALTHRLLAFSRQQTLTPKPTNINRLIGEMEELIRRTIGPEIAMEMVGASGLWPALVDPGQLENALLNLCINARDAMPDGGRITIETANKWLDRSAAIKHDIPEGQYLSLCVTDTGTGMPPAVIARAFDPFFTTKPLGQGTGLGLSMIHGFAKQSGGQVRIYSEVGDGTTVCLYLPRHYGDVDVDDVELTLREVARAEQGETVLIVDDEPSVRMLVTEVLEDLGYTAIEAADSVAGLKVLQSDVRIDLLVTDVGLPGGMNGRQMADAGRVRRPDLKVLFVTGYAENAVLGHGYLEPGMEVLTKPFAMEALGSRIKDLIRKS